MKILPRIVLALGLLYTGVAYAQDSVSPAKILLKKKRKADTSKIQFGVASYYAKKFHGRKTASGELYDHEKMTAAHNGLPLGTWVKVTNQRNGRSVIVKINDRLHYKNPRLVDMSGIAAKKLGFISKGLVKVKLEVLGRKKPADMPDTDTNK